MQVKQVWMRFSFWVWFFNTRKETILTMLTILSDPTNTQRILWCLRSQFIFTSRDPKNLTAAATVENSALCLHGPMSTFNGLFFKILKFSWAWRHPHSSPIFYLGVNYDNCDCHILCVCELKLHQLTIHLNS